MYTIKNYNANITLDLLKLRNKNAETLVKIQDKIINLLEKK